MFIEKNIEKNIKGLHIITWGCQMNVYDSKIIQDLLVPLGYKNVTDLEDADIIVLNTCHIREKATEKVFSELGKLNIICKRKKEKTGVRPLLILAGCVAQAAGKEILSRAPYVDFIMGPQTYHKLPELLTLKKRIDHKFIETNFPTKTKFDSLIYRASDKKEYTAFLTIQEGCDKFCSYCVVPYTRGAEVSRSFESIVQEAKDMAHNKIKEITLLGQNVNAYQGKDINDNKIDLTNLLNALSHINGIERLRYTTSHPKDMTRSLIELFGHNPKVMPFLHLPVQTGSNNILKLMNRGHSIELYYDIVADLKKACPEIALSSDFIVGHPGETDQDFQQTLDLVKKVKFASSFSFKYSKRPGTPAAVQKYQISEDIKNKRLQILQKLLKEQQIEFNYSCLEKKQDILVVGHGKKKGQLIGRSPYLQPIHFFGDESLIGEIVNVHIKKCYTNSLGAVLTDEKVRL